MILDYLIKFHFEDCINILSEPDNLGYYSVRIDFLKLFESYPDVGDKILCSPIDGLPSCDKDIIKAQQIILERDEHKIVVSKLSYSFLKRNVHARFFGLPVCPELHRTIFPKNVDLGCFLKVSGTVVRVTQSKMLEYQRKYVCVKCKYENCVEAEFENRYILKAPSKCGNEEKTCRASTFTQVHLVSREYCKDYQEIKIQEQVNKLSIGTIPGSMWVVLEDDLVDCCKPGDDVVICGTVRRRWRPTIQNKKSEVELVLQANYIEVSNAQKSEIVSSAPDVKDCFNEFWGKYEACPLKGRDRILESVCSQVYGLHLVKLAVLLTVITGSNHVVDDTGKGPVEDDSHTTRVRGQCHLLLVGDPGTGKSQLLRTGVELTSRSVFTSGAGSTRAGLTCAALREEGEWQLEAGALVLSDGGVCCIDEISQLREHDRTAIHEAMEQQTISIAKAGIVCKLNTRCAIIAACNPKGRYETDQPLSVNVSLGTPLLSRFDLIFILLDSKNKAWDKLVSSYILFGDADPVKSKKKWDLEKLQMYISLVGPKSTQMTKSANIILQAYYMTQRKSEHRDPSRTTVRMLDSLVRLSQAHCRLMYRTTILPVDAITAISLVDLSMQDCTLDDTVDALHSTTPKYPDFEYLCTANKLLGRLNLPKIWQEELLHYGKLLQVDHKTLEHDINNGNRKLFGKFDDVTDDNIYLSASLITSSYFNVKKGDTNSGNDDHENNENLTKDSFKQVVNEKFAATLKKHATLNKVEKDPQNVSNIKTTKRKRKEVLIDTAAVKDKLPKKSKKSKVNLFENDDDVFDSMDEVASTSVLNAVPSVNDALANLGIDLNFDCYTKVKSMDNVQIKSEPNPSNMYVDKESTEKLVNPKKDNNNDTIMNNTLVDNISPENLLHNEDINKLAVKGLSDNPDEQRGTRNERINKLKQFVFKSDRDFNKYEENPSNIINNISESMCKSSSSQLSIFESSDCDIDLDI